MRRNSLLVVLAAILGCVVQQAHAQRLPLANGVQKVCALYFNKDATHSASVENDALPCLKQSVP